MTNLASRTLALAALLSAACVLVLPSGSIGQTAAPWKPVKSIDFSSKHNVLIRNEDGALQAMDLPYYRSKLIAPGTWQIESDGDYSYLIEGDNEALAIDTGYGSGNIREYLQTLTKKPVRYVANTHDHFDHTANNAYFDRAYMSAKTAEKATTPFPSFAGVSFPKDYPHVIVADGFKFQLGAREIEVFLIPNHTAGGTAYLDRKQRILFSGDEIMEPNEPLNVSVAAFAGNMRKLKAHRGEFDRVAGGPGIFDAADVDKYLAAAEAVLAGGEGAPILPRPPGAGPGAATPAGPAGQVIYRRRFPRGPDLNLGPPNPNMRRMIYEDRSITYNMTRIRD
jgi:glyoxylase-like metal-dependent hydrolase (beta-lactamase superfamily II)